MEGLLAWAEGSGLFAGLRALNRGLWRLWSGSTTGRCLGGSLGRAWRTSAAGTLWAALVALAGRSAAVTLVAAQAPPRPSLVARGLRRIMGAEREPFRATGFEHVLLYFLIFFVPLELWLITRLPSATKYLGDLALVLLLLVALIRVQQAGWPLRRTPADLPVVTLLLAGILSAVANAVPVHIAALGLRAYVEYYGLYLVLVYLPLAERQQRNLLLWFLVLGVAIALFGDAQKFLHVATPRQWLSSIEQATTRAFGTLGNPNTFGAFLVLLLSLLGSFLVVPVRGGLRLLALLGVVVALPALLFTLSREALLAFAVVAVFIALIADRRLLVPIVLVALALPFLDPHVVSRFSDLLSNGYIHESSTYGRLLFWERGVQAWLAQPLLGWGPGRFGGSIAHDFGSPAYQFVKLGLRPIIDSQHVQTLTELGAVGYLAYLALGVAALGSGLRLFRRDQDPFWRAVGLGLAAGTIGLYVQSLFASLLETHEVIIAFWFVFGLAASRLMRTRAAGPAPEAIMETRPEVPAARPTA